MAATTRRRKVFPHLNDGEDNSKSSTYKEERSYTKKDEYDNNKSKSKIKKVHPSAKSKTNDKPSSTQAAAGSSTHHLIPLPLVLTVLICSGFYWIVCFRDVMATGKPILDDYRLSSMLWGEDVNADLNYLVRLLVLYVLFCLFVDTAAIDTCANNCKFSINSLQTHTYIAIHKINRMVR